MNSLKEYTDITTINMDGYYNQDKMRYGSNSKLYEISQFIPSTQFPLLIPEILDETIQTFFEPELVGRNLCRTVSVNSPLVRWLYERGGDADIVYEGSEHPTMQLRYDHRTARMLKLGVALEFTSEAIEDTMIDIEARHIQRAAQAVARKEDEYIMNVLYAGVADGSAAWRTGEHVANHVIDATDTDFLSNASGSVASGSLTYDKIMFALRIGQEENIPYTDMIISPAQAYELNKFQQFQSSGQWGNLPQPVANQINSPAFLPVYGSPTGLTVTVTPHISSDAALFINRNEYAQFFVRRPLMTANEDIIMTDSRRIVMNERIGCAVTNPIAGSLITGLSYDANTAFTGSYS